MEFPNPGTHVWQEIFLQKSFLSEREAFPPWLSVTLGFRLSWHALRPHPVSLPLRGWISTGRQTPAGHRPRMTHFSAAKQRPRNPWDRQALGVPNFSRKAAFLPDAMAALPRKWVNCGAPTLESTSALARGA
jgi:hypothetical protein